MWTAVVVDFNSRELLGDRVPRLLDPSGSYLQVRESYFPTREQHQTLVVLLGARSEFVVRMRDPDSRGEDGTRSSSRLFDSEVLL